VEEQTDGPGVCPLQIVKDQQQGTLSGQCSEEHGILLKEIGLPEVGAIGFRVDEAFLQPVEPRCAAGRGCPGPVEQSPTDEKGINQVWARFHQHFHSERDQSP